MDRETPSTSGTQPTNIRTKTNRGSNTDERPVKLKIGDKVYKIKMSIREWLELRRGDFEIKKRKTGNVDQTDFASEQNCAGINSDQYSTNKLKAIRCMEELSTIKIKSDQTISQSKKDKATMTDSSPISPYEKLSPEEQSLKSFFNSMLQTTQTLPEFHQRRIKGDLVKALRYHGVEVGD